MNIAKMRQGPKGQKSKPKKTEPSGVVGEGVVSPLTTSWRVWKKHYELHQ